MQKSFLGNVDGCAPRSTSASRAKRAADNCIKRMKARIVALEAQLAAERMTRRSGGIGTSDSFPVSSRMIADDLAARAASIGII